MIQNGTQACKFSMLNIMSKSIGEDEVGWCFCSLHAKSQWISRYCMMNRHAWSCDFGGSCFEPMLKPQNNMALPSPPRPLSILMQATCDPNFEFVAGYLATFLRTPPPLPRKTEVEDCHWWITPKIFNFRLSPCMLHYQNHEKFSQEALADLSQKHRLNPFKHRFQHEAIFLWVELQPLMLLFFICFDEIYLYPILLVILVSTNIPVLAPRGLESHRRVAAPCLSKLRDEQGPAKQGCQAGIPAKWFIFFHFMVPFSATLIVNLHVWMNPSF